MFKPEWITIELTNRCNKACSFCGRAEARKEKTMVTGDMPMELFDKIISEFEGSIIQFNKDGEPLLYPALREVGNKTSNFITNIVTNGILLWERKDDIISNFSSLIVSVFEDDEKQFDAIRRFVDYKGNRTPLTYIKFLGDYYNPEFKKMGLKTTKRSLHLGSGDEGYSQSKPPIPEVGVCLDFLYKPAIDFEGNVHMCNRFDPTYNGMIGNIKYDTLSWIWNSPLRMYLLDKHKSGERDRIPFCSKCEYWGLPAA